MWTTLDIGIKFDKPTSLRAQLSKMIAVPGRGSGKSSSSLSRAAAEPEGEPSPLTKKERNDYTAEGRFAALKSFYRNQIAETATSSSDPLGIDYSRVFSSSPGSLNRIMSIYASSRSGRSGTSNIYAGRKEPESKPSVMREAMTASEGMYIPGPDTDNAIIRKMASEEECGYDGLASIDQRISQVSQTRSLRFVDDLLPLPMLLRTKRAKRCKACKHILVKPESKPQSTRFRMRLIALGFIPLPTIRPLVAASAMSSPSPSINLNALTPAKPTQFLLTLKNHMFDPVRITLATPSVTPGAVSTKVTILCPQFEIGANNDAWVEADEALQASAKAASVAAAAGRSGATGGGGYEKEKVAEAGKVWDKGQNWSTVVLEVVPGLVPSSSSLSSSSPSPPGIPSSYEDEDVLEIPIFVRMEWDTENQAEQPIVSNTSKSDNMVKRELAYWMVLGVGRIGLPLPLGL